jgi:hypothetical protein
MNPTLKNFIECLRADPQFAEFAEGTERAVRDIELEAVRNWHARRFLQALEWIVHPIRGRTIEEKIEAIAKLVSLPPGPRIISMRLLTGWN